MVGHKSPCNTANLPFGKVGSKPSQKALAIPVVQEDLSFLVAPAIHVMESAGKIYSWPSRHNRKHSKSRAVT